MMNNEKQLSDRDARSRHAVGSGEAEPLSSRTTTRRLATGDEELQLAAIADAVFVVDANEMIIDANVRAEILVGYARAELVGRAIGSVIGGLDPSPIVAPAHLGTEHARFIPATGGAKAFHRGGATFLVDVLICPHEHSSVLAIVRPLDGTASGFRDDDVIQIVHDLKSPLATIALESELLDASIDGLDHDALCRAVQRILLNVGFLDRMIQDLLDLSAFDAGRFSLRRNPVEMRSLIEGTLERVVASRERDRVFFEGESQIVVSVDGLRLERVIANLVENAFKYAPKHSGIVVHLSRGPATVCVAVVDAGPGIADDDHAAIFDKYRRARASGSTDGNGLGLYVAKRIVEAHGGRIGVERVRDAGSRFFFELPLS